MSQNEPHSASPDAGQKLGTAQAYGLIVATVFIWAASVVAGRAVHQEMPPIGLTFWRWAVAGLVVVIFTWPTLKKNLHVLRSHIGILVLEGAFMAAAGTLLFTALNYTTAINATLVNATQPMITVFLAWTILRQRINKFQLLGIVAALIGVGVTVTKADLSNLTNLNFNIGDILVVLAIVTYSLYAIFLRKLPAELGVFPCLGVILLVGAIILIPIYAYETIYVRPVIFNGAFIGTTLVLALFASIISMAMWNAANRAVGPNRAAVFINLIPVFGAVLAIVFLNEKLFAYHIAGGILVCIGILMVVRHH